MWAYDNFKLKLFGAVFTGSREDQDQAKLIGGVVAGLVLVGITVGLICWLCSKKSRYCPQCSDSQGRVKVIL